jgi:predicted transglutaminase-like cysteine proteinase
MSINFDPSVIAGLVDSLKPVSQPKNLVDLIPKPSGGVNSVGNLLSTVLTAQHNYLTFKFQSTAKVDQASSTKNYGKQYLQVPNQRIKELAAQIVNKTDSPDVKVQKINAWVIDNIGYQDDWVTNGTAEHWSLPTETLNAGVGDCEDGAFLIHSLAIEAGVDPNRLRTYGGEVWAGAGAATGGHAWTAYKRTNDNEWVALDFSYFPTKAPVDQRVPLRQDNRYIDDFFYFNINETVDTPYTDRIHNPVGYAKGSLVDEQA